jgi:hypothetical protein
MLTDEELDNELRRKWHKLLDFEKEALLAIGFKPEVKDDISDKKVEEIIYH